MNTFEGLTKIEKCDHLESEKKLHNFEMNYNNFIKNNNYNNNNTISLPIMIFVFENK